MSAQSIEIVSCTKPLSSNRCWRGRRFKTQEYKDYEKYLLITLPKIVLPPPPYRVHYEWGFSSSLSDCDNPIKPLQDILQKKYKFDDKLIFESSQRKILVKKGCEYFKVRLESIPSS